jgi:hypothetical protein
MKTENISGTASLLSKSTQNLSSCIKEEIKEWEDEIETPRKSLNTEVVPYQQIPESDQKDEELNLDSSDSDLDFLNEEHPQEEPRGDLEEIIKSASDMTRNRRDQFFQSLNSIHLVDTLDKEDQVHLYDQSVPEKHENENPRFEECEGSFLSRIKRKRQQMSKMKEDSSKFSINSNSTKIEPQIYNPNFNKKPIKIVNEIKLLSPKKNRTPQNQKEQVLVTPLKKKKSFRDFLRTKKKREHEKVIHIDLRPKSKTKVNKPRDFNEKIKAWNKLARAGAGVRYYLLMNLIIVYRFH